MKRRWMSKSGIIPLLVIALLLLSMNSVAAATTKQADKQKQIRVFVLDKEIKPAVAPVIKYGSVFVEFRSIVQALGYKFKYDAAKKVITADSEDASFRIDLKTGRTYVNGSMFIWDTNSPMIIASGANTLVNRRLFHAAEYLSTEYYSKTLKVYEDPWGKPKKADLRAIQSVIDQHYRTLAGFSSITGIELISWGTFVTVSVSVSIKKSGDELLDRIEHATLEMNRGNGNKWTIHNIESETEYLEIESLAQREAIVPEPDKSEIVAALTKYIRALNEENAEDLVGLRNPDMPWTGMTSSKEELILVLKYGFLQEDIERIIEFSTIVSYKQNLATLFVVQTRRDKESSDQTRYRSYGLVTVIKASDGKWYLDENGGVLLKSESF